MTTVNDVATLTCFTIQGLRTSGLVDLMRIACSGALVALFIAASAVAAAAQDQQTFQVATTQIADEKAVFATVQASDVVAARARIRGVVAGLTVDEGDRLSSEQQIATIGDEILGQQLSALDARIRSLEASLANARIDLDRAEDLVRRGVAARARLDEARTAFDVAQGNLDNARAERDVIVEQEREGAVLAPAEGVVLNVAVTDGSVVLAGETIAEIAVGAYVLRLELPERHARRIAKDDEIRIGAAALSEGVAPIGRIVRVYPRLEDGRVLADAEVEGLGDYFVGERVRVFVVVGERAAILIPSRYVSTRFGVDFVDLQAQDERQAVAVQLGRAALDQEGVEMVEVLSGLRDGDILVTP